MPSPPEKPPHKEHKNPKEPHEHPPHEHPPHEHPPNKHGHHHEEPRKEPPGAEWFENDSRKRSLDTIAGILRTVGEELEQNGVTSIRQTEIAPPEECTFTARYERTPEGKMQLLYEIRWDPRSGPTRSGTPDDPLGDKIKTVSRTSDSDSTEQSE